MINVLFYTNLTKLNVNNYIVGRIALKPANPEAGRTVTRQIVQVHHIHLFVKTWKNGSLIKLKCKNFLS